jgi:predicted dehydrogenase
MNFTPEEQAAGRRNFLKVLAGTPALAALGAAALVKGPVKGGPVRLGYVGLGGQGRVLLEQTDPAFGEVKALCDVNPTSLARADEALKKSGRPAAAHYSDWQEMLQKEDVEGVVVATPLWTHAEIVSGCLDQGKHVLCEKMMAWDVEGAERMLAAARKNDRVLEIGYQRFYNPMYQTAYQGIVKAGVLGDIYHARLVWHRNGNWRRQGTPPTPDYDPSRWGYPSFEHLVNWRLYWRYSKGLLAELASHQVAVANWFFGGKPEAVQGSGGVHRFKDGREVHDHVYTTFEYPQGRTAVFTSIESNAFDHYYEMYLGTKGTLILRGETEAMLFEEGGGGRATGVEMAAKAAGPVLDASESRAADAAGATRASGTAGGERVDRNAAYRSEVSGFCAAVRVGKPLACGPERAVESTRACVRAHEAIEKKARLAV